MPPLQDRLILVVDDDDEICRMIVLMLRRAGASSVRASCVNEAEYCLGKLNYDVVLTDLQMDGGSGSYLVDVAHRLKTPIVAMSGALPAYLAKNESGFDGQLAKPFDEDDLIGALQAVMVPMSMH